MKELFEQIQKKYDGKEEELNSLHALFIDVKQENTRLKQDLAKANNEIAELKTRWSKAEKLFGGVRT